VRFLGNASAPARADLLAAAASDASPHVRIVASEALIKLGEKTAAAELGKIMGQQPSVRPLQIQALDALTYIGDAADAVLPQIRAAAANNDPNVSAAARYIIALRDGSYTPSSQIFPAKNGPSQTPLPAPAL
jgi:HEAT repeat protein